MGVLRTLMLLRLTSVREPSFFFILCRVSSTFVGLGGSSNTGFIFSPLITSTQKDMRKSGCHIRISQGTFRSSSGDVLLKPAFAEVPSYVWLLVTRVWTPRMAANMNAAQSATEQLAVSEQRLHSLKSEPWETVCEWKKPCVNCNLCQWLHFKISGGMFPTLTCEVTQLGICGTGQCFL